MITLFSKTISLTNINAEKEIKARIIKSDLVYVKDFDSKYEVERLRRLPRKGIFRLIIPRTFTDIYFEIGKVVYKIKFDSIALFFLIVCIGSITVEFTIDRVKFPREYPVAVPFIFLGIFIVFAIYDVFRTKTVVESFIN